MREYLEKNDIGVTCTYVDALSGQDRDAALEKVREANPRLSFPTLIIGDAVVVGFNPEAVREALSS
jgi:glutaredoxin